VWPLALANVVREDDDTSIWGRLHARQALVLGALNSLGFFLVLALPLVTVLAIPGISTDATIALYAAGLLADAVVGIGLLVVSARYAARAARGALFSIPLVTPIVERCFPLQRP
jgi:ABC-type arginine transport system permease subunit